MSETMSFQQVSSAMGSTIFPQETTGPVELLPNPDFVFPARPSEDASQLASWGPITQGRRGDRNIAPPFGRTRHTASLLPNFTFNPAGSGPTSPTTPPLSPSFNDPSTPSGRRHRRGGSEFIGKDHKTGTVSMVNTSPIRSDSFPPQTTLHLGPPPGRRHAHRRSGAISCHDLSSILQPKDGNIQTKSDSAPTSPMDLENRPQFSFPLIGDVVAKVEQVEPKDEESPQKRPPSRARVGFSERVEYIRPLSIISSETESSMSTIRGHSVSGSFSSMVSAENVASSPHRLSRPILLPTVEIEDSETDQRPQTAVELNQQVTETVDRPRTANCLSDSAESKTKRKGFWGSTKQSRISPQPSNDSLSATESLSASPPVSPSYRKSLESDQETLKCNQANPDKKPRKVKSWAHSLISRKHKGKKGQRPSTPPAASNESESETDESASTISQNDSTPADLDFNFDVDNTVTIISESSSRPTQPELPKLTTGLVRTPSDILSPVIDLDAALGPFNTPPLASNARDLSGRQPPRPRRSMHSLNSAGVSLSLGPSHRRTESAPELVPFDFRSKHSHTVMPDVFEEEDEEDVNVKSEVKSLDVETSEPGLSVQIVEMDQESMQAEQLPPTPGFGPSRRKKSEGLSISTESTPRPSSVYTPKGPRLSTHGRGRSSIEVVDDNEEPQDKGSEETITPPHTGGKEADIPTNLRFNLPLPLQHVMTPDTLSDISASPFFSPSQASLETPRLGTSTSSMNENLVFSFGEPGPEVRMSVDDVPSLTSSRSTMTSPMVTSALPVLPPPSSQGRAASIYSTRSLATAEIQEKRKSMASLSRFMAGGFGAEKSKLSIEQRPMSQHTTLEHVTSNSKRRSHRLSKLMRFWKSKDEKSTETAV